MEVLGTLVEVRRVSAAVDRILAGCELDGHAACHLAAARDELRRAVVLLYRQAEDLDLT